MIATGVRETLPRAIDRRRLGRTGLSVGPICLGITGSPDVVPAAFDAGVNFFFFSADLHWPLYESLRRGLAQLLARGGSIRDEIVVAVASYLDLPLFQSIQFHEVLDAVPGLERIDLLIAGGVCNEQSFGSRLEVLLRHRSSSYHGSRGIGASFHNRSSALMGINSNCLDAHYVRYNPRHTGACRDLFPYLRPDRTGLSYNFKTNLSIVTEEHFRQLGLGSQYWLPGPTDYYRFVLTNPAIDGILCSPQTPQEVEGIVEALNDRPLSPYEEAYMVWLAGITTAELFQ